MTYLVKKQPLLSVALPSLLIISIAACSEERLPIKTIYASNNCGITEQQIQQINTASELAQSFAALPYSFPEKPHKAPNIDFTTETVILYALGQKPNNGYSIEQMGSYALIKNDALLLPIRTHQPNKNNQYGQMITTPCQFFTLPKKEFSTVTIAPSL